jgi:magnesium transporter
VLNARSVQTPTLQELVRAEKWSEALSAFEKLHPSDAASAFSQLSQRQQRSLFKLLSASAAASLLPYLLYYDQFVLLHLRPRAEMLQIINDMEPDDRMRLLDELPEPSWQKLVDELTTTEKAITERSAHYDSNLAGRYVTPEFISLRTGLNAAEALAEIRRNGRGKETLNLVYILAADGTLIDELKLSSLVMAHPLQPVSEIVDDILVTVKDSDTLDDAIVLFEKYDRVALPVVDDNRKMLGILTFDDVMDVARLAATREIQKFGGMEALDAPYFSVQLSQMLRKRGGWLALLFLGEMLTATAMSHFEGEIAKAVVLALFVPLIISSGGNSGSQATSLLIRSLALREVRLRDWWRICSREIFLGLCLGTLLGTIGFVRIVLWEWLRFTSYGPHYLLVAGTVCLSLIGVVGFGTLAGSMLPFILRRFGADPATSSAPLVATLVDVTGLIIYFTIARIILHGTLL